jgi:hypothetical protein
MKPKVKKILDKINKDGVESVIEDFDNNIEVLLNFLKWGEVLDELDLSSFEENANFVYHYMIENGYKDKIIKQIINTLSSVSYDGTDYFYEVKDLEDLSEFFTQRSRDISPRDVAEGVFGEDYWEPFSFYRSDVNLMRDVYDELNKENQVLLRNIVVERYGKDLIGVPSENVTDIIEKIGTEDENGDYDFYINNENVMDLFSEDETMNFLFKYYFEDLSYQLFDIYTNSYNTAYQDEYYNKVWDELRGTFLDIDAKPIDFQYGKRTYIKLKITNVLPKLIEEYLNGEYCSDIDSLGDYTYLIREGIGCGIFEYLSFRISDYPDSRNVEKNINESFKDYF